MLYSATGNNITAVGKVKKPQGKDELAAGCFHWKIATWYMLYSAAGNNITAVGKAKKPQGKGSTMTCQPHM